MYLDDAMIEAASVCAATAYLPVGFPVLVPKPDGSYWTFCTHDRKLFGDFLANGFCNMQEHSPSDLFSSRMIYNCPDLAVDDPTFELTNVGEAVLEFALPLIVAAGFVLGFTFALRHASLDSSRRIQLYPVGFARRAVLVLAAGLLVALMIVPWILWMAGALVYGLVSLLIWPFFGAAMFEAAPKHPLEFWAAFGPLVRWFRELMGGVGDVRLLRRSGLPQYTTDLQTRLWAAALGIEGPRPAHIYTRKNRRYRRQYGASRQGTRGSSISSLSYHDIS